MSSIPQQHASAKRFETQPILVVENYVPVRSSSSSNLVLPVSPNSPLRLEQQIEVLSPEGHEGHFKPLIDLSERVNTLMQEVITFSKDLFVRNGFNKIQQCSSVAKYMYIFNQYVYELEAALHSKETLETDYLGRVHAIYQLHAPFCPRIAGELERLANVKLLADKASQCWGQAQKDLVEIRMLLLWSRIYLDVTLDTPLGIPCSNPNDTSPTLLIRQEILRFHERLKALQDYVEHPIGEAGVMKDISTTRQASIKSLVTDLWSSFVVKESSRIDQKIRLEVYNQREHIKEIKDSLMTAEEVALLPGLHLGSIGDQVLEKDKENQRQCHEIEEGLAALLQMWKETLTEADKLLPPLSALIRSFSQKPGYFSSWIPSYFSSSEALPTTPSAEWIEQEISSPGCLPFQLGAFLPQVQPARVVPTVANLDAQEIKALEKQAVDEIVAPVHKRLEELSECCKAATARIQNFQEQFVSKGRIWSQDMLSTALRIKGDYTKISQLAPELVASMQKAYEVLEKTLQEYHSSLPEGGYCFYDRLPAIEAQRLVKEAQRCIAESWTHLRIEIDNLLIHRYWLDTDRVYADAVPSDWVKSLISQQENPQPEFVSCDYVYPGIWIEGQIKILSNFSQRVDEALSGPLSGKLSHHRDFVEGVLYKFLFEGLQNYISQRLDAMDHRCEVLKKRQLSDKMLEKIRKNNTQQVYETVLQVVKRASAELQQTSKNRCVMLLQYRHAALTLRSIIKKINATGLVAPVVFTPMEELKKWMD